MSQGKYTTGNTNGTIAFSVFFPNTKMGCGELSEREEMVINNLLHSKKYTIIDNQLIIACEEYDLFFELYDKHESVAFEFRRNGGFIGLNEKLKFTVDSTYYSVKYMDLSSLEIINYQTTIKTSGKQWDYLMKNFDRETFTKIQDGPCYD